MQALIHLKRDREHEFNCGYVELMISLIMWLFSLTEVLLSLIVLINDIINSIEESNNSIIARIT